MKARLQTTLRIRPGEGPVALRVLATMFVALAGASIGANGVESLFFSRFGPDFLPYLYVVLGVVTFALMMVMSALLAGPEPARRLVTIPLLLSVVVLAARGALLLDARWFYPTLWVVMMIIWTIQVMTAWGLAGAVHDTRQAKRLFPLYGAGLILGGVVGGLATGPLAGWLGAENLLVVWGGGLLVTFALATSVLRSQASPPVRRRARVRGRRTGMLREMAEGFRQVRATPLLRWMAIALVLFALLYFTLALRFAEAATARFPSTDQLAGFLGLFMALSNGGALLASLFVTNRLFARFGVPSMVLVLALLYLAGFLVLALGETFVALVGFRFVQMLWVNGVWATGWQALFNVVPTERRAPIRSFMDGGPLQAGIVLSGLLLVLADRVLSPRGLALAGVGAAAVAVWAMWRARRGYAGALVAALRAGNPDVFHSEEEPFGGAQRDADAHAALLAGASEADPAVRRIAVEILATLPTPEAADALRRSLADPDAQVRATAVRGLAAGAEVSTLREIAPSLSGFLADPYAEVRAGAAAALTRTGDPRGRETLLAMAEAASAEERGAAITRLAEAGQEPGRVLAGLTDPDPSVRRTAAAAAGRLGPDRAGPALLEALGDPDAGVRDEAADALASLGPPAAAGLEEALARADLEAGALLALTRTPGAHPEALRAYASGQLGRAARYHDLWRGVPPGRDEGFSLVADAVLERALRHGMNALRAVAPFGDRAATMEVALANLGSRDPQQRANALETLDAVGDPELIRPLLALWDTPPRPGGDGADVLARLLEDEDPWLRACAAFAARTIDDPEVAATLREMARSDGDPLVRETAAEKGDEAVETLSTLSTMERVLFLRKVRLFADLSPPDLKQVAEIASEHLYPDGEVIAEQGEAGDEMHIVVSGEIRVTLARDRRTEEVARRTPGEYVGEMAILSHEPRMASLVSSGEVRTLSIDRRRFERILRERPDASLAVMRVLCDRLRESHTREPVAARI